MADYVIDWEKFETKFEGEKVVLMLKKLTREAFLLIIPELEKVNAQPQTESNISSFKAGLEMQGASRKILEHHMLWKDGFTINGKAPTVESLCEYSMFSTLVIDIMSELIRISTISGAEIKN